MSPRFSHVEPILLAIAAGLVGGLILSSPDGFVAATVTTGLVLMAPLALAFAAGRALLRRTRRTRRRLHDAAYRCLRSARWRLAHAPRAVRRYAILVAAVVATGTGAGLVCHAYARDLDLLFSPACTLRSGEAYPASRTRTWDVVDLHPRSLRTFGE